jgi:hypothetical protein
MTDPTETGATASAPSEAQADEQVIRERVRELTAQVLSGGRLDPEGFKDVVRSLSGGAVRPALDTAPSREAFVETLSALDAALHASSQATHAALQALLAHGAAFSDNDLKNAFAALQKQQQDYVAVATRIADATTGNLRGELLDLTLHAQRVGADAGVRFAQAMSEFAHRIGSLRTGSQSGLDSVRQASANVSMLTSGVLAGFADALRQQSEARKAK